MTITFTLTETFFYFQNIFLKFVLHTVSQTQHLLQVINMIKKRLCCITLKTLCHDCVIYGGNHCSGPFYSNLNNTKMTFIELSEVAVLVRQHEENTWTQLRSHCTFLKPPHRVWGQRPKGKHHMRCTWAAGVTETCSDVVQKKFLFQECLSDLMSLFKGSEGSADDSDESCTATTQRLQVYTFLHILNHILP